MWWGAGSFHLMVLLKLWAVLIEKHRLKGSERREKKGAVFYIRHFVSMCFTIWSHFLKPAFSPLEGTKITVNNLHPRVTEEDIVVSKSHKLHVDYVVFLSRCVLSAAVMTHPVCANTLYTGTILCVWRFETCSPGEGGRGRSGVCT